MKRPNAPALVAIVGASFLVRMVVGWLRATPALFPDEYTYAALGRSLAESGRPLIRGTAPHFPALLQPLLTAPAWLVGDVGLAYRLVQGIGALAMSLAAIPTYVLARRLELSERLALALAALAVLVPDLVYASFVVSEPIAYPLVLAALAAATSALARPGRRSQLAFVAFTYLAVLTRIQFAVLPLVFAGAVIALGVRERRVRAALREQLLALCLLALPAFALVAAGPGRGLGAYRGFFGLHAGPLSVLRWASLDAMALAYASGWIIVPGALLGLWLGFFRPRSKEEAAFAATAGLFTAALLLEAGVLQSGIAFADEIQERYVFYLIPLAGICFALYASRGWPQRIPHLVLAAALVVLSVRLPLGGFAVPAAASGSPLLFAVAWLSARLGQAGAASLAVAGVVLLLSAVAVAGSRRPRLGTPLALALALCASAAASAGAVAFDTMNTRATKHTFLPDDASWVDRSGLRDVALVQSLGGLRAEALEQLFWNRSLDRVLLLPGAARIDRFGDTRVRVAGSGSLIAGGRPVRTPLLVDGYGSFVRLRGARLVASGPTRTLWRPAGTPRLALYAVGRYHDGWLADAGAVYVWPEVAGDRLSGTISFTAVAPRQIGPVTLRFQLSRTKRVSVRIAPGTPRTVRVRVCSTGMGYVTFRSSARAFVGLRAVSVRATAPVFTPDWGACPAQIVRVEPERAVA